MRKTKTWNDNVNDVIRDVIFPDEELLDLMMIPDKVRGDIMLFIQKYFVKDVTTDELVTTENVRVCYAQSEGRNVGMNMVKKYLSFDIYVKDIFLHNATDDMLQARDELIAERLKELLTDSRYTCRIQFSFEDSYDLFTKTVGYHRYRIVFSYKTSY